MARGKKAAKELSPEEKLQQALVPVEEQPHPIPENWCWIKAKFIAEIYTGNSISEKIKAEKYTGQMYGLPFVATKDVRFNNEINYETDVRISDFSNFKIAPANTALLCIEGGSAGRKVGFTTQDVCFGNKLCALVTEVINAKLVYFYIKSQYFIAQFNRKKHGLIGGVSVKDIAEIAFAIPPLVEQQRIVSRIESLFAKLDEAKEKAQAVVDGFELRKSAILHKAFMGELTERWRKEHEVSVDNWQYMKLSDVATVISGYAFSSDDFDECNNIPCIKITNVGVGNYISENYEYLPTKFLDTYNRFKVNSGNILISLTRSYIAAGLKVCICDEPRDSLLNQRVALIKNCNIRYIYYYLRSSAVLYYVKEKSKTTNQPNLSIKDLNNLLVPIPIENEQNEIVSVLNNLLDKEEYAKSTAETVLSQIDTIKKAILARAFRGELGTSDPAEESAVELIKAVL